jgi:metal-responsive CopG/Arc/MetJ family transcriptional regulator
MSDQPTNLSLPDPLRAEIEKAASAQGRPVNEVLAEAVDRYLKERQWASLKSYGKQKASERGLTEADVDTAIAETRSSPSR